MSPSSALLHRGGALLAINLLFLMVWGFAGLGKVRSGVPAWFGDKFGATILARFPGLTASFWLLTLAELLAFALALAALLRGEFLSRGAPTWLKTMLVWSLVVVNGSPMSSTARSNFSPTSASHSSRSSMSLPARPRPPAQEHPLEMKPPAPSSNLGQIVKRTCCRRMFCSPVGLPVGF
jgi:hypothetical protein